MTRGVTQDQVTRAADALLARGERPTIEKVRAQLGTGSPNTLLRLIDVWWADLAKRLACETRLPDLPADVAAAFKAAWTIACEQGAAIADKAVSETRDALEQQRILMAAERLRWSADIESARSDLAAAQGAQASTEARLADHQRLVEQLQAELRDVKAQRDKLHEQADILVQDMMRLGAKLEKQEKAIASERLATEAHIRTVEDRAHAEVDRARAEIKVLRTMHTQAERAGQAARDAAALAHKEHVAELRTADREATAQRARADALENQLKRLTQPAGKPRATAAPRRTQKKVRNPRGTTN